MANAVPGLRLAAAHLLQADVAEIDVRFDAFVAAVTRERFPDLDLILIESGWPPRSISCTKRFSPASTLRLNRWPRT